MDLSKAAKLYSLYQGQQKDIEQVKALEVFYGAFSKYNTETSRQ